MIEAKPIPLPPRREGVSEATYARAMLTLCGGSYSALARAMNITEQQARKLAPPIRPPYRPGRR